MKSNLAILWDIENVTPPHGDSMFVDGLLDYARQLGNVSAAIAIGNWTNKIKNQLAVNISGKGFELIHLPQSDDKRKRRKNSSDFVLIAKATEMIFQYPHIRTYIILTGDIDFRPLLQTLKKHGKMIIVVCDSNTASEQLLELADEYTDYRNLIPGDASDAADAINESENLHVSLKRDEAFPLLTEAVMMMDRHKKIATPGSVKVRMQLLNENFSGNVEGFKHWQDFITEAARRKIIEVRSQGEGLVLSLPETRVSTPKGPQLPQIITILMNILAEISSGGKWVHFSQVSTALLEQGINIKQHGYPQLKKLIIDAEKRELVETKNDDMRWYVRRL